MDKLENFRKRNFAMVLYPEDERHMAALKLLQDGGYKYAAILHDKDTYTVHDEVEEALVGTPKKPHYHVLLKFPNDRWRNAMATELGIAPNYIKACVSSDGALRYLVHNGFPEKYQYPLTDVIGPLAAELEKLIDGKTEDERILEIVESITSKEHFVRYTDILIESCKAGRYGELRRLGNGVKWLIEEHNAEFERKHFRTMEATPPMEKVTGFTLEQMVSFIENHKQLYKEEKLCEN